jgi:phosphoenolpyruvate synthase/pyruvate phosphate dikinase
MTIDSVPTPFRPSVYASNAVPDVKEFAIQGKSVMVQFTPFEHLSLNDDEIKKEMASKLAQEIMKNSLCEFTKFIDAQTMQTTYRARAFLTPNDQVRLLRENNKL